MCWPLSTRSPVSGSVKRRGAPAQTRARFEDEHARAGFDERGGGAKAGAPAADDDGVKDLGTSLSAHRLSGASRSGQAECGQLRQRPDLQRDPRALQLRHADPLAEHVVAAPLDALKDLEVDRRP